MVPHVPAIIFIVPEVSNGILNLECGAFSESSNKALDANAKKPVETLLEKFAVDKGL